MYIDAEGTFRPQRLLQIADRLCKVSSLSLCFNYFLTLVKSLMDKVDEWVVMYVWIKFCIHKVFLF